MKTSTILLTAMLVLTVLSACQSGKQKAEASLPQESPEVAQVSEPEIIPGRLLWSGHTIDANKIVTGSESMLTVMDRSGKDMRRGQLSIASIMDIKQVAAIDGNNDGVPVIFVLMSQKEGEDVLFAFSNGEQGKLEAIELPEIPENLAPFHMGGDSLYVIESTLYRQLELTKAGAPSGTASLLYSEDAESGIIRLTEQR